MLNFIIGICAGFAFGWLMAALVLSYLDKSYEKQKQERELREAVRELNVKVNWLLKEKKED